RAFAISGATALARDARATLGLAAAGARDLELPALARGRLRLHVAVCVDIAVGLAVPLCLERRLALGRLRVDLERALHSAVRLERGVNLRGSEIAPELHALGRIPRLRRVRVGPAHLCHRFACARHAIERSACRT